MHRAQLLKALRFFYTTQDHASVKDLKKEVENAVTAGITMVHYRNTDFSPLVFNDVLDIRNFLKCNHIPFLVQDNILLAKALDADGVVLETMKDAAAAVSILGRFAVVGIAVTSTADITAIDPKTCDFCIVGTVIKDKADPESGSHISLTELSALAEKTEIPIIVSGKAVEMFGEACFDSGAAGIGVTREMVGNKGVTLPVPGSGFPSPRSPAVPWNNEFDLIERLLKYGPKPDNDKAARIKVSAGDDACLLDSIQHPVITTDSHVEGVHFRLEWQTPEAVGQKAVTVTLSDLAASYAKPVSLFINLGLPPHVSNETAEALYKGVGHALAKYGCTLGGGNISANSRISLDLFAIGEGRDIFPVRSAALPGYGLYCTGPLGLARAGLDALFRKASEHHQVISCFKYPVARFDAADILASHGIDCVMDISDGLKGDAGHMAKASNITIEFSVTPDIIDPRLDAYCRACGLDACEMAVAGGEDYELLFACPPDVGKKVKEKLNSVYQVGMCRLFDGCHLRNTPSIESFQHGK